jgi:hypothetical protein
MFHLSDYANAHLRTNDRERGGRDNWEREREQEREYRPKRRREGGGGCGRVRTRTDGLASETPTPSCSINDMRKGSSNIDMLFLTSGLVVLALLQVALAGCSNGRAGVGLQQFCNVGNPVGGSCRAVLCPMMPY